MYFGRYMYHPSRNLNLEEKHIVAVNKSQNCGTSVIGTMLFGCPTCDKQYNILRRCGHRFCAKCGYVETQNWAQKILTKLAPIKHHHIVFTLPKALRALAKINKEALHDLLFKCAQNTILNFFKNTHNIKPGIVSVLHTFGSTLNYHPHVHMIVTAGGQNDLGQLIELKKDYLVEQRILANQFRKLFIKELEKLISKNKINLTKRLTISRRYDKWLSKLKSEQWICSIQEPLKDLLQVVGYVGRYTKRACISEYKIISIDNDIIKFTANDYANTKRGEKPKQQIVALHFVDFLDRLLQHVPTKRYRMVRYSGMYNSHYLKKQDEKYTPENIKHLTEQELEIYKFRLFREYVKQKGEQDPLMCPNCNKPLVFEQLVFTRYRNKIDDS